MALGFGVVAQGAHLDAALGADGDAASGANALEEIVVTATRRKERLQDVAVSATAFTQEKLDVQGLRSIDDLSRLTPGITFQRDGTTTAGNFNDEDSDINIRGVDSTAGTSTVGIYIDDTPIQGRHISFTSFNAFPALFDLERVEVLRGPQGTLFGAGSEGGTVRFIQPSPGLQSDSMYARSELATTKNGGTTYELGAAIGGPIVEDKLGFRLSASFREDGGWANHVNYWNQSAAYPNSNYQDTVVVRGKGLLIGLEFPSDAVAYQCAGALFRRGVLVAGTYSKARTIRIEPPLGIPIELLRELLNQLEDSLQEIAPQCRSQSIGHNALAEVWQHEEPYARKPNRS